MIIDNTPKNAAPNKSEVITLAAYRYMCAKVVKDTIIYTIAINIPFQSDDAIIYIAQFKFYIL